MKKADFYNPWWETLEDEGVGTLLYRGKWNLFDQIVLSKPLLKNVADCVTTIMRSSTATILFSRTVNTRVLRYVPMVAVRG